MKALDGTELELPISDEQLNRIFTKYKAFYKKNYNGEVPSDDELLLELSASIFIGENNIEMYSHQTKTGEEKIFSYVI